MSEPCPECHFDGETVDDVAAEIESVGRKYGAPLTRFLPGEDGTALVRTRPGPDVWSPLEYACHVRDLFAVFDERTHRMVAEPGVALDGWDHDAAVIDDAYNDEDPSAVAATVAANASAYASTLRALDEAGLATPGADESGETVTVDSLSRVALHMAKHHQLDIGRGLRTARGR